MSNTAPAPATVDLDGVDEPSTDGTEPGTEQQGDPDGLGDAGRRALQAERTARAEAERLLREAQSQLTSQAARITEIETGSGTLATQVTDLQGENLRLRTAVDYGVPSEHVHRLVGSTAEELAADAQALLALMGAQSRPAAPRADPSQGSRTPAPQTPEAAFKATFAQMLNP